MGSSAKKDGNFDPGKPVELEVNFGKVGNEPGDTPSDSTPLSGTLTLPGVTLLSGTSIVMEW